MTDQPDETSHASCSPCKTGYLRFLLPVEHNQECRKWEDFKEEHSKQALTLLSLVCAISLCWILADVVDDHNCTFLPETSIYILLGLLTGIFLLTSHQEEEQKDLLDQVSGLQV
jgi:hypothetical protein